MKNGINDIIDEIKEMQRNGCNTIRSIEILKVLELRRIAVELADINKTLVMIQALEDGIL